MIDGYTWRKVLQRAHSNDELVVAARRVLRSAVKYLLEVTQPGYMQQIVAAVDKSSIKLSRVQREHLLSPDLAVTVRAHAAEYVRFASKALVDAATGKTKRELSKQSASTPVEFPLEDWEREDDKTSRGE